MKAKFTRKVSKPSSRNGSLPKPKKVGRPKIELPVEMAHGFGQLGLTFDDMADLLGISRRTVAREFSEGEASDFVTEYRKGRANTNRSIRMKSQLDVCGAAITTQFETGGLVLSTVQPKTLSKFSQSHLVTSISYLSKGKKFTLINKNVYLNFESLPQNLSSPKLSNNNKQTKNF